MTKTLLMVTQKPISVLTLIAQTYMESLLNDEMKALLIVTTYMESLLNDRSVHDSRPKAYIGFSP